MWSKLLLGVMVMVGTNLSDRDGRLTTVRHLNLRYELPSYKTPDEWLKRARFLQMQVQIACGLFPS
ncbi:MAG: hypothetical protein N2116_07640, partial [Armatimonadetes bacterium]|nr:hypothetical protein [Armatimonadota bacterium]